MSESSDAWSDRLTAGVVRRVRCKREDAGLSVRELSERCTSLGYPIPRNVLQKIEGGYRKYVTLPELLVLAGALRCSVMDLLIGGEATTEVLPGRHVDWQALHVWLGLGEVKSEAFLLGLLSKAAGWRQPL